MIYKLLKHNGDSYSRLTRSKKACFNYFNKLNWGNINKLCVYTDEWHLERVVGGYYTIYEYLKDNGGN